MTTPPRRNGALLDTIEDVAVGVGRAGYGLLRLPLGLLPAQSRAHMEQALRELSYGFASLPGDFARIAGAEIERWAADEPAPAPARPAGGHTHRSSAQHLTVDLAAEPIEEDLAELVTEEVAASLLDIESLVAAPPNVGIAYIEFDPPGRDIDGEYVLIRNDSGTATDLTGWTLSDEGSKHSYTFPAFALAGGAEVKLWSKQGTADAANLYWGSRSPIWNNDGDSGVLRDAAGNLISRYTYAGSR